MDPKPSVNSVSIKQPLKERQDLHRAKNVQKYQGPVYLINDKYD